MRSPGRRRTWWRRESRGNPLFIDELVKHIQGGGPIDHWEAIGQLDLDEVLWERIRRQPEDAQRLLGTVAVSGRPIRQALAFQAAELDAGGRVALASLRTARLIRLIGQAQQDEIEIYHDRIRETVVAHLPPDRLRWHHERLAAVLSAAGPVDPELLAGHYRGAGDAARAGEYYGRGADQAAAALAFDHAARLYRTALELHPGPAEQARPLRKRLADALANAGRGAEAAQAYLNAARSAPAAETLELKRLASTQLLISGHVDEGLALSAHAARPAGHAHARDARAGPAVAPVAPGAAPAPRPAVPPTRGGPGPDPEADADRPLLVGRRGAEHVRADPRGRLPGPRPADGPGGRRALPRRPRHGHGGRPPRPSRACPRRTRSPRSWTRPTPWRRGSTRRTRAGWSSWCAGSARSCSAGWKAAEASLERAEVLFRDHCTGVTWERDTGQNFALWALYQMGEFAELRRRWTVLYREAQERGDLYAASNLSTLYATLIKLAGDQRPEAEDELEAFLAARNGRTFNLQHTSAFESLDVHRPVPRRRDAGVGAPGGHLARV